MSPRPRRRFGQNFLVDGAVIDRIVRAIDPQPGQCLVEIGPGRGALTRPLLAAGATVHALEIDRDLAAVLPDSLGQPRRLEVHCGDALKAEIPALCGGGDYRLVGNLPYNISTPLLFHALAQRPLPGDMHFMLQLEVVERIAAPPGGRDRGRLSVTVQNLCEPTLLFVVPPRCFEPQPAVESAMLRLTPRRQPQAGADPDHFDQVVRAAFAQRRKTLRNALARLLQPAEIAAAGVDAGQRAEQLSIAEFDALAKQLQRG